MSNAASAAAGPQPRTPVVVDPAIAAVIRDPAAPEGVPGYLPLPESMAGKIGLPTMVRSLVGHFYYGIDHAESL